MRKNKDHVSLEKQYPTNAKFVALKDSANPIVKKKKKRTRITRFISKIKKPLFKTGI